MTASIIDTKTKFECEVLSVRFRNDQGFCILAARALDTNEQITIKGVFINNPASGNILEVSGAWEDNLRYGVQFKVKECKSRMPETRDGMIRYLSSDFIPGVGVKLATAIVDHFGSQAMNVVMHTPERLYEVKGVGAKKGRVIIDSWISQRRAEEFVSFIEDHGLNYYKAMTIFKHFNTNAMNTIQQNPYAIVDVPSMTFNDADMLAEAMGMPADSDQRIRAGVKCALTQSLESGGHTCAPLSIVKLSAVKVLSNGHFRHAKYSHAISEYAENAIAQMDNELTVIKTAGSDEPMVSFVQTYDMEKTSAQTLLRHIKKHNLAAATISKSKALLEQYERHNRFKLDSGQQAAVLKSASSPVSVITGGPGTGKTTLIKALIAIAKANYRTVGLAAPTGRAARRMTEATGCPAMTLHRLLGIIPDEQGQAIVRAMPGCEDIPDLLIVDEASMMDAQMLWFLLRVAGCHSGIVFVGDADQLPSVGPGNVLADLINSGVVPVSKLSTIHRQQKDSGIITAAYDINNGIIPTQDADKQFTIIEEDDPQRAVEAIKKIMAGAKRKGLNMYTDIQVLTPQHAGATGTDHLNQELKDFYRKPGGEITWNSVTLAPGDKVMQTANDYNRFIYNGDPGIVTEVDTASKEATILFDKPQTFKIHELDSVQHAEAVTIHKSQGMEYPVVIIPLMREHSAMLYRRLLYTAVTRASQQVTLVGSKAAIAQAVGNNRASIRQTMLCQWLQGTEPVRLKRCGTPNMDIDR